MMGTKDLALFVIVLGREGLVDENGAGDGGASTTRKELGGREGLKRLDDVTVEPRGVVLLGAGHERGFGGAHGAASRGGVAM